MRVSIEGLPGSGKTELLKLLKITNDSINVHLDDSQDPWLNLINKDQSKYILGYNINRLIKQSDGYNLECVKESKNSSFGGINEINLYENSPYTMQHVASSIMLKNSSIHQEEFKLQEKLINTLGWYPDYIIYLDCPAAVCFERIKQRSSENVKTSIAQLKEMFEQYEWVLDSANCDIPVYRINANDDIASIVFSASHVLNKLSKLRKSHLMS